MAELVLQDYVLAHMWFELAGASAMADDQETINDAREDLHHVATLMTAQQIAEAQRLAAEWKPQLQEVDSSRLNVN